MRDGHEFLIGELEDAKGFYRTAVMRIPVWTSSPGDSVRMVADILREKMDLTRKRELHHDEKRNVLNPIILSLGRTNPVN